MNDYRAAFKAACADLGAISALLGFEGYPCIDALLRSITDLIAAKQPEPRDEVTDEVVQWGRVIEIGDRHGMQWAGKTGWRFENDDSVHAFANEIARFALNSRAGEGQ